MSMETIKLECQEALALVQDAKQLADFWTKYLSKGGEVQKLMSGIKNVPNEEKKAYGQAVNEVKVWVQGLYDAKKEEIDKMAMMARYDEEVVDCLAKAGYDAHFGARPLRRAIQRMVEDALSEEIIAGNLKIGDHVQANVKKDQLNFTKMLM